MKKIFLALAMLATAAFSINAFADTKIATVDMQQVVQSMPEFSQVTADLKKQFGEREKKIEDSRAALKKSAEDFSRNGAVMTANDRQAAQQKLIAQQHELQQTEQAFENDIKQAQAKKLGEMVDQIKKVIASVAAQQKYDLVMIQAGVLYANNQVTDITKQVMDAVKKK
jgi:outer membrane protein